MDAYTIARVALELVVATVFLGAGLYVLAARRARWFVVLAAGVAAGLVFESLRFSEDAALYTAGLLLGSLWSAPLLHLVFAFPDGQVRPGLDRMAVGTAYVALVPLALPFLFWSAPFTPVCEECPRNLAVVYDDQALAEALMGIVLTVGVAGFVFLGVLFARRLRRLHPHQRRLMAPIAVTMSTTVVLMGISAGTEAAGAIELARASNLAYLAAFVFVPVAMLAGLVRSRAYRAEAISGLVERLDGPLGPDELRDALAFALDDPSLEVGYWVPEQQRHVDGHGRPVDPRPRPGRAWTTVERAGRPVALLGHDARLDHDRGLVQATGAAVSLALERERLAAALRTKIGELQTSRERLVEAGDAARRRFERDLHDGVQPRLTALLLNVNLARRNGGAAVLADVDRELRAILDELRAVASGILPPALADLGFEAAVTDLAARMPFRVTLTAPPERLPDRVEFTAYFIVAEALTNAAKHAHPSAVDVSLELDDGRALLSVRDDGDGGAAFAGGSGLRGLVDRVDAFGGHLALESPPGAGTTLRVELPCGS